jgi:hypothetical protein
MHRHLTLQHSMVTQHMRQPNLTARHAERSEKKSHNQQA